MPNDMVTKFVELLLIILNLCNANISDGNTVEWLKTQFFHLPLDNITLNSNEYYRSNQATYRWMQIMGQRTLKLRNRTQRIATITEIKKGFYAFRNEIRLFNSTRRLSRIVQIEVFDNINKPPKANAGGDRIVYLPTNSIRLLGSASSDDRAIVRYQWYPAGSNPAGLEVIGNSDQRCDLLLRKLSPGKYGYSLEVYDSAGLRDVSHMTLTVMEDRHIGNVVQINFEANLRNVTHLNLKNFKRQISLILSKSITNTKLKINILNFRKDSNNGYALLEFNVAKITKGDMIRAFTVIKFLRPVIFDDINIFMYPAMKITTPDCSRSCFLHGYCDSASKSCVCDMFWINNLWKDWGNEQASMSCEWNIFYTLIVGLLIVLGSFVSCRLLYHLLWRIPKCGMVPSQKLA